MTTAGESKQYDGLLIIRALASLTVIWAHSYAGHLVVAGHLISQFIYPSGELAVFIFYLISGYTIGSGFASGKYRLTGPSLIRYYINRILRIVPLYYFVVILNILIFNHNVPITSSQLFQIFTFTANVPNNAYIGLYPLSMISTLMQFYLVAPIVFVIIKWCLKMIPVWFTGYLIFMLGAIVRLFLFFHGSQDYMSWFSSTYITVIGNIDLFLFGTLLAIMVRQTPGKDVVGSKIRKIIKFFPLVVGVWYVWGNYLTYYMTDFGKYDQVKYQLLFALPPATALVIGLLIYYIAIRRVDAFVPVSKPKDVMKLLVHPKYFLFALGTLSWGMYVWHYPVLNYLFYGTNAEFSLQAALFRYIVAGILTTLLSLVTYIGIEYPMSKLKVLIQKTG